MRTISRKSLSAAVVAAALLAGLYGCSEKEIQEEAEIGFSLQRNVVEMTADGGTAELMYFVENPVDGLGVELKYDADWIGGFDTSEEGLIKFEVEAQTLELESRSTVVDVMYGEETQSFTVTQFGNGDAMEFSLVLTRATNFIVKAAPADPEMRFWINRLESSVMEELSDEELLALDLEIFKQHADYMGKTLEEWYELEFVNTKYLSHYFIFNRVEPKSSHTAYAYGMNGKGERLTPIYRASATMKDFELISDVEFTFGKPVVKDGTVSVAVTPSDKNVYYCVGVDQNPEVDLEKLMFDMQCTMDSRIFMNMTNPDLQDNPPTLEQMIEMLFLKGDKEFSATLESPKAGGIVFAYAIDDSARVVTELFTVEFEPEGTMSDNKISLDVPSVGTDYAEWTSVTTNDDPYVVTVGKISDYSGMTNEAVLEQLLTEQDMTVYEGNASGTIRDLEPNTGYVLFAFGYEDGTATTNLVRKEFYTVTEQEELGCRITYKYFDGSELYDSDPERFQTYYNKVVVVAEPVLSGNPESYYYGLFVSRQGEKDDATLIDLLTSGNPSVLTTPVGVFTSMYNREVCFISVAKGTDGNFSPVERNYVTFTVDGTSPIEDFPENL